MLGTLASLFLLPPPRHALKAALLPCCLLLVGLALTLPAASCHDSAATKASSEAASQPAPLGSGAFRQTPPDHTQQQRRDHSIEYHSIGDGAPCSGFTSCVECGAQSLCMWCQASQSCSDFKNSNNCSSTAGGKVFGNVNGDLLAKVYLEAACSCGVFEDCGTCALQPKCVWCPRGAVHVGTSDHYFGYTIPFCWSGSTFGLDNEYVQYAGANQIFHECEDWRWKQCDIGGTSVLVIASVCLALVVVLLAVALGFYCYRRRKRLRAEAADHSNSHEAVELPNSKKYSPVATTPTKAPHSRASHVLHHSPQHFFGGGLKTIEEEDDALESSSSTGSASAREASQESDSPAGSPRCRATMQLVVGSRAVLPHAGDAAGEREPLAADMDSADRVPHGAPASDGPGFRAGGFSADTVG